MIDIIIQCNKRYINEREYIYNYFFQERLGLKYNISYNENICDKVVIELPNKEHIYIADILFNTPINLWLKKDSLPKNPLHIIKDSVWTNVIMNNNIVELYGEQKEVFFTDDKNITIDIFGSAFFLLTGYEELVLDDRNQFGNFPHDATVIGKEKLIQRPIVDEYVELLWNCFVMSCPTLIKKQQKFRFIPTHDIDCAFLFNENSLFGHLKNSFGDILKRKNLVTLWQRNASYFFNGKCDPYNVYDWLMDLSDSLGVKSIFYFKNSMAKSTRDYPYRINTKAVKHTLINIDKRNHIIGFHPSFETLENEELFAREIKGLRDYCTHIGINQKIVNIRSHYLRYSNPQTSRWHEKYEFIADSTLGHRDRIGFRRGTCHEYFIYDIEERKQLNVKEFPLIVMEQTMKSEFDCFQTRFIAMKRTIDICNFYKGNFVLLWHNATLVEKEDKLLYKEILKYIREIM